MSEADESLDRAESPAPPAEESAPVPEYLDPSLVRFRTEGGRLQVSLSGAEWKDATAARLFPLSEQDKWISIADREDKETGILLDTGALDHDSLESLEAELRRRYLIPQILNVLSTRTRFDLVEWTVETDRGRITFLTRRTHETAQRMAGGRIILTDVNNNRFDVPDVEELDANSRRLVEERL